LVRKTGLGGGRVGRRRLEGPPQDRARELILTRYRTVRRYLPLLLDTIDFQATDAGEPILDAVDALARTRGPQLPAQRPAS
jgi:hypothetical protein